ncbi:PucR family transcriptional regulator [Jiangella asiatica]|uniref:PucR family transcriptional regulator n=1 Tax=Jiangella asiatica TaxID=2530372 RepID=A0A4R5DC64_9ACTN|nr:PucR family transcriptional regulator [Jiangella asiatica]TDE08125.1 PucR family transcriptional regulator [Jiangella asiatica]
MVSVAQIVATPGLALRAVALPHADVPVTWVATSELTDPTPFLEGGEVLLTTGMATAAWTGEWDGYVCRLAAAGVVAVGFGVGLTHDAVPEPLARACADHALNLVEVPRATRFVDISRLIARKVGEPEQAAVREALVMQRELTMAAVHADGLGTLVRRLADVVGGAACVVDPDGRFVVGPGDPVPPALAGPALAAQIQRQRPHGLRASSTIVDDEGVTVIQPIGLRGRPHRYLALRAPSLTDDQRAAVTTAVALLSLTAEGGVPLRAVRWRLRRRAVELVADGDPGTATALLAAVSDVPAATIRLPDPLRVLRASGTAEALDDAVWVLDETGGRAAGHADVAARLDDELWLLVDPARAAATASWLRDHGLRVGVGATTSLADAGRGAATAGHALSRAGAADVVDWDAVVDDGAVGLIDPAAGAAFASAFAGRVAAAATDPSASLATLESFLRHHGRHGAVAAELGIHRNTVRNRLRDIEAALGRSLDDPQVRMDAWVALRLRGRVKATRRAGG